MDGHDMDSKWMDMTWTAHEWGSTDGTWTAHGLTDGTWMGMTWTGHG